MTARTAVAKEDGRNFPYPIAWIVFLACMFVGAGLLSSPDPGRQVLGFALLFAPIVAFGLLMALFYWRSRRQASE